MSIKFTNNCEIIVAKINNTALAFLEEAKDSIASQASDLSPVDTGQLKRSFGTDSFVLEKSHTAYIGSSLEYALWQEYGTGEYALNGNGRKGGWIFTDPKTGKAVFTRGVYPKRMLHRAFLLKKGKIISEAQKRFGQL